MMAKQLFTEVPRRASISGSGMLPPRKGAGRNLRAFGLPFGTTRAAEQEEGARQDDYEARHNPQLGEQVLKLFCAFSLLDLGGDQ